LQPKVVENFLGGLGLRDHRQGQQQLIVASRTADAGETVAEESAAQVALKLGANEARQFTAGIPILGFDEKGRQVC